MSYHLKMRVSVFGRAAECYDLLYRDKDYAAEAACALAALRRLRPGAKAVLDLGCGTGRHAFELARLGCRVTGVDRSAAMLAKARVRARALPAARRPVFHRADLRRLRLGRRFDAVVALFHVFSYLSDPAELEAALSGARAHLRPGGVLLFDCWYGPAVLAHPPKPRVKRAADGGRSVERSSFIRWERANNAVAVRHRFRTRGIGKAGAGSFQETHRMRYWFREELSDALRSSGLSLAGAYDLMTGSPLGRATWNACFTAVAPR